ncbi:hypothetical protein M5K25_025801 [Dendrobium thyrsiflorum]|uniref:Uncharacterized protein n=1 Tax=Dendrobium thyrsiflorum TaxID=117978 RepID=A0ABD0U4V8_DENTH
MAGRKVEVLEGELGQLKTDFEEKISDFQNQFSSIHEKMDGRFAALEDLMKKMIDDKQKPASSETIGGHGRGDPNPSRGRENPEVGVLEGDDGMPPLEPLSREELSRGYDRQEAEYVGRREEFYRRGAGFERIQRRGADFERGRADFHSRGADFERIQRRGADFEGRREEIHRRGADFEGNQRRGDDFEGRRGDIRIFSIAFLICMFGVLPLNYYGQEMTHNKIPHESLEVFTIANVKEGSQWLWVHCLALHIISFSACTLLYFEYQRISKLRLDHITARPPKLSHFSILVRSIPRLRDMPLDDVIKIFFITYHGMSYLSHQRIHRSGAFHKIMTNAEKVCTKFVRLRAASFDLKRRPASYRCGLCGGTSRSCDLYDNASDVEERRTPLSRSDSGKKEEDCSAALVFFKTRYAAVVASRVLQSSNPMLWVTDLAPEPDDLYWSNLSIPYRQLWIRRISIVVATILFLFLFLIPVTFVQGLTQLETLQQKLPFLRGILTK